MCFDEYVNEFVIKVNSSDWKTFKYEFLVQGIYSQMEYFIVGAV